MIDIFGSDCVQYQKRVATLLSNPQSRPSSGRTGVKRVIVTLIVAGLSAGLSAGLTCDNPTEQMPAPQEMPMQGEMPVINLPAGQMIGEAGGTVQNPTDDTSVTVPAGAFTAGQTANVSVVGVSLEDVRAIAAALGLEIPEGFELMGALQVGLGQNDPTPRNAFCPSLPEPGGMDPNAMIIHTLIEPASIQGIVDNRPANLIFDGEVTMAGGRASWQISSQNFGSPPGRSCVVQIPPAVRTCFIDGVVTDSNGSPVAGALVSIQPGITLVSRTNAAGFYRAVVREGTSTVKATSPVGMGETTVNCNPTVQTRISGVNIVIDVLANAAVPMVTITNPATDVTVDQTTFNVQGTVTPDTIQEVVLVTQTGDFADSFTQMGPVVGGSFSETVILTGGRENTIIATVTDNGLIGSDSKVITVIGAAAEDLRFTMTWDQSTDLDLYVRTPGANGVADAVDGQTIHWRNRNAEGGMLDVDDTSGFGPENITFPPGAAASGTYAFAAHYWSGAPASKATVSVFVNGLMVGSFSQLITVSDPSAPIATAVPMSVFNIGTVSFPAGGLAGPAPQSVFINP